VAVAPVVGETIFGPTVFDIQSVHTPFVYKPHEEAFVALQLRVIESPVVIDVLSAVKVTVGVGYVRVPLPQEVPQLSETGIPAQV
jgi:hypothetical protein